ncbi:MAG TPA: DUF4349 domain-containing protein [Acidimicrobiales bacterium]|nr:DUF4349 domain-containing protein [Acidimicrobiales bacterium]
MAQGPGYARTKAVAVLLALALAAGIIGAWRGWGAGGDDAAGGEAVVRAPSAGDGATAARATTAQGVTATGGGSGPGATDVEPGPPLPPSLGADRVVKTATLEVEVAAGGFAAAFSQVATIAAGNGGFVARSSSHLAEDDGDGRQSAGSAVVRVPQANFDAARQQLIDLGDLRSQQLEGEDVGGRLTDLDARLRNLRSHEEAIRLLMTKAVNVGETIEIQRQLSGVREQIEQLAAEQARLSDAVAHSTITLALAEPGVAFHPGEDGSPLGDAFAAAVDGTQAVLAAVIVGLGYVLPIALLAFVGFFAARPVLNRRREAAEPA